MWSLLKLIVLIAFVYYGLTTFVLAAQAAL